MLFVIFLEVTIFDNEDSGSLPVCLRFCKLDMSYGHDMLLAQRDMANAVKSRGEWKQLILHDVGACVSRHSTAS